MFEAHAERYDGGPYTLHQLRHSRLTHAAEEGASTPVLMKLSGHTSVRSLVKHARVSDEGLQRFQADRDPAARRRRLPRRRMGARCRCAVTPWWSRP
ncbi:tyrosine-type recombinase/integrase [Nocardia sp. NPDC058497]|uniref:tyrosine-type recombinase/integrase n=1 Tax=Nocardia sp. NPDC058497 TaxID=3346529 RepID=UPI003653EDFE